MPTTTTCKVVWNVSTGFSPITLVVAGALKSETEKQITLVTPDNQTLTIPVADIDERTPPKSAMPSVKEPLALRELRDRVAFLATLK